MTDAVVVSVEVGVVGIDVVVDVGLLITQK